MNKVFAKLNQVFADCFEIHRMQKSADRLEAFMEKICLTSETPLACNANPWALPCGYVFQYNVTHILLAHIQVLISSLSVPHLSSYLTSWNPSRFPHVTCSIVSDLPCPQLSSDNNVFTEGHPLLLTHRRLVKSKLVPIETFSWNTDHINEELPHSLHLCRHLSHRNIAEACLILKWSLIFEFKEWKGATVLVWWKETGSPQGAGEEGRALFILHAFSVIQQDSAVMQRFSKEGSTDTDRKE